MRTDGAFRVWIGLDWAVTDDDLRRRNEARNLGTMTLPITIDGQKVELIKKL